MSFQQLKKTVTIPMAKKLVREQAGVEDPTKLKAMKAANDVAKKEGKPPPYLSLDLDQPPPHKKGGWLSTLFRGDNHPAYIKNAARKIYHDPVGPFGVAAQERLLAYTAAHTAPIKGMDMSVHEALKTTPAPKYGLLKGAIPHADSSWGHASSPPQIKSGLVLKNVRHDYLKGLFDNIRDDDARQDITSIFEDRFKKQKTRLAVVAKANAAAKATTTTKVVSTAKAVKANDTRSMLSTPTTKADPSSAFSINGGRRGRSTRKVRRHTKHGKSRGKSPRRKRRTRRH